VIELSCIPYVKLDRSLRADKNVFTTFGGIMTFAKSIILSLTTCVFIGASFQSAMAQSSDYTDSQCTNVSQKKRNKSIGNVLGGIGGGLLGREIAGKDNEVLGSVLGGIGGAIIGGEVAKILTPCDKELVAKASESALETGSTKTWRNSDTGRSGTVSVLPATTQVAGHEGKFCRVKEDEIIDPSSGSKIDKATYCKGADGTWTRV